MTVIVLGRGSKKWIVVRKWENANAAAVKKKNRGGGKRRTAEY